MGKLVLQRFPDPRPEYDAQQSAELIRQLEEINYDNPINVKRSALTVTNYKRAILPSDCVDVIEVYLKESGKEYERIPRLLTKPIIKDVEEG